jgi:hypothetical protein
MQKTGINGKLLLTWFKSMRKQQKKEMAMSKPEEDWTREDQELNEIIITAKKRKYEAERLRIVENPIVAIHSRQHSSLFICPTVTAMDAAIGADGN